MKPISLPVYAAVCLSAAAGVGRAGEQPPLAFGEVFDGRVFAVEDDAKILEIDWRGEEPQDHLMDFFPTAATNDFPPRWKIGFGALVITHSDLNGNQREGMRTRDIKTCSLPLENSDTMGIYLPCFGQDPWCDTARDYNLIWYMYECMRNYVNYRDKVYDDKYPFSHYEFFFDLVLEKPGACRYFVLASEGLQLNIEEARKDSIGKPPLKGTTGHPAAINGSSAWEHAKDPRKPMLGVWQKDKRGQWALVDKIKDPCFNERFHTFVQGDDWFFVTDSGKVFLSRKPDKDGDERKLKALWDDAKRPIIAAVTDASTNKTFLFGRPEDKEAKPFYFELAEKPKPTEFDADVIKPPLKPPEPLKTVMGYARFLADQKEIKLPDKGGKEKDK